MKFVCVKARPLYDARHVNRILAMLRLHATHDVTLTCLTDDPYGIHPDVEIVPIAYPNLKGWWHKMQIFQWSQTQTEPICYIDLDTIITGNIDPLAAYQGKFAILNDFILGPGNYQSSVMLIQGGFGKELADAFYADMDKAVRDHAPDVAPAPGKWGDQYFIERHYQGADILQDLHPGMFVSYKIDIAQSGQVPHGASVVCFHGHPRPFHFSSGLTDAWRML